MEAPRLQVLLVSGIILLAIGGRLAAVLYCGAAPGYDQVKFIREKGPIRGVRHL